MTLCRILPPLAKGRPVWQQPRAWSSLLSVTRSAGCAGGESTSVRLPRPSSGQQLLVEDGSWADWSPDGTEIAFASNRDGNVEFYVADADGSNERRLTENDRFDFFPAWAPDGRSIAFATVEQKQIYVMNVDGSNERQLTAQGLSEDPAWSPDGSQVVFQSSWEGNFEIYTLNVEDALQGSEGPRPRRLTNTRAGDFWPSWGPVATSE